jgi:hypothetical protein
MTWYALTPTQITSRYHWNDLPAAERVELKRFIQDVRTDLPLAMSSLGGVDPGAFLGAVIGGSLARGTATVFSDYDVFLFRQNTTPLFSANDPRIVQNAIAHLVHYRQRNYSLSRRVNLLCGHFGMFYNRIDSQDEIFGYDLETNVLYPSLMACRDALI